MKRILLLAAVVGSTVAVAWHGPVAAAADRAASASDILTPRPGPAPRINGARVVGVRPGRPFLYRIPTTGDRPLAFAVEHLPAGLAVDSESGIIRGSAPTAAGPVDLLLKARNASGSATRPLRLVVGDQLALTPPMGWNSWYIHYDRVSDQHIRAAADAMIRTGMADFGYAYVNIDDCWTKKRGDLPYRDDGGAVLSNKKFPDMKALANDIHGKGLRVGLYISPGPWTCTGYVGSYQHERADAKKFAEWGFDFLKYDWCSYGQVADRRKLADLQRPYRQMGQILHELDRDIILNLCQYGMGDVWEWGGQVGGNCWRTTGDLGLERGSHLPGFYSIGLANARHWRHARPGQWNDPDYILIGWVGDARHKGKGVPTELTPNEQYSYMSMWCLMAAPLIYSGDMTKLDDFTLNVLCNAEVIDVDQDPLGKQARIVRLTQDDFVLAKPLADGSVAIGLFNIGENKRTLTVGWSELGLSGRQAVRDLWRQRDGDPVDGSFTAPVGRHGVAMVRLHAAR